MKKRFFNSVSFLLLGLVLFTCNKKKEGDCIYSDNQSKLLINIVDNHGNKVDSAKITIFDSYQNYLKAVASKNDPRYALDSVYSQDTKAVKLMIDPYKDHWILATLYDTTQQKYLSSEINTSMLNKLQSCSDYHLTILIEPVGANVAFWTPSGINLPIKIQFNNSIDSLIDSTATAPTDVATPAIPKQLIFPVKAGTYQYQASSAQGCSWQGEITVTDGQYLPVRLEPCQRALVAFYFNISSAIPTPKQTIEVYIDNNPTPVGTLTNPYSGILSSSCPAAPSTNNVLFVYLEPGVSHFYKCVSAPGTNGTPCVWPGTTPVLTPDCLNAPIYLGPGCN
jgi:hypothetical protein